MKESRRAAELTAAFTERGAGGALIDHGGTLKGTLLERAGCQVGGEEGCSVGDQV